MVPLPRIKRVLTNINKHIKAAQITYSVRVKVNTFEGAKTKFEMVKGVEWKPEKVRKEAVDIEVIDDGSENFNVPEPDILSQAKPPANWNVPPFISAGNSE